MRFKAAMDINLDYLRNNFQELKVMAPQNKILFMIKSDAYGHGMSPIVRFAIEELGLRDFGLASLGEALYLREKLSDLEFNIYVFSDLELYSEKGLDYYLDYRILPVISSMEVLDLVTGHPKGKYLPLVLKFNTGMNRLGFRSHQLDAVIELLKQRNRCTIHHLMSHFATASEQSCEGHMTHLQYEEFKRIKDLFQKACIEIEESSMANSGAIEQGLALEESYIRPGLLLYGPSALSLWKKSSWKGRTISSLFTHILDFFEIKKGEVVGYGATPIENDGILVQIAFGYGDGLSNEFQGVNLYHKGFKGKIVGRVSMDITSVLFPIKILPQLKQGDKIYIWDDKTNLISQISDEINVIPYEILCGITGRVPRVYSATKHSE